jgi:colanic acid biosynthesis glycosyl transferase WcaI
VSERVGRTPEVVVLCPHFEPDTAPTGRVMSRIVHQLAERGFRLHVVTALPWYRRHAVEAGWTGRWVRTQPTAWGSITRVHPFPGADRSNLLRRALGFVGFSLLVGAGGLRGGGWFRRADAVIAMSPPLTLGITGRIVAWCRRADEIFNVQDVFPDAAVETGAIENRGVIAAARWLERLTYRCADAVTVLSDDLLRNVTAKVPAEHRDKFHVIPNFVDTDAVRPADRMTPYRRDLGIGDEPVVMYAGNVGFSQSLGLLLAAAPAFPDVTFVINGGGSGRADLERAARGRSNVRFGDFVPDERLGELLATGDIHVVPLRAGLAQVSVPSKVYSILAAGRPVLAAIDTDTEIPRLLDAAGAGVSVRPDDQEAFDAALRGLLDDPAAARAMGERGRKWVESWASPSAVAEAYARLIESP